MINYFSESGKYRLELDPKVGSLELLDGDLTNEAELRRRIFKKIPIAEEAPKVVPRVVPKVVRYKYDISI